MTRRKLPIILVEKREHAPHNYPEFPDVPKLTLRIDGDATAWVTVSESLWQQCPPGTKFRLVRE